MAIPDADADADASPSLTRILHAYAALAPVRSIPVPPAASTPFAALHALLLHRVLRDPHLARYPPAPAYQRPFWKWALALLERRLPRRVHDDDDGDGEVELEIDERLYRHYTALLGAPAPADDPAGVPAPTYATYYLGDPAVRITLLESRTTVAAGTTGLRTWRASRVLGAYLLRNPGLVARSTVLELGAGTGFLAVLIAALQLQLPATAPAAPAVVLTDVDPAVLELCRHNVSLPCNRSSAHPRMSYRPLDWCDALLPARRDRLRSVLADADVVVGADIVFDPELVRPLVATLALALSGPRTRVALVAVTLRNEATLACFLSEIRARAAELVIAEDVETGPLIAPELDQVDAAELEVRILRLTTRTWASPQLDGRP